MTTQTSLRGLAAALAVAPVFATPVFSQEAGETGYGDFIGTVTLGESRRGIQTQTATSETVISQEELDERQATSMGELLDSVPNVTLVNGSLPQGAGVSIRGLGAYGGTYGTDGKVSVVIDGVASGAEEVYRNGSMLALEPELFREITVTRGPAESFQYSSGAMGGTVEAETKDATDFLEDGNTFSFRQKLGFESNGNGVVATSILSFAPDDRFNILAFAGYRDVDARKDGAGKEQDATGFTAPSGLLKANYHLTDASTLTFSMAYNEIPEDDVPYNAYDPSWTDVLVDRYTRDTTAYAAYRYNPAGNDLINIEARLTYKDEAMEITSVDTSSDLYNADHDTKTVALRLSNEALFSAGTVAHTLSTGIELKKRERQSTSTAGSNVGYNDLSAPGGTDESIAVWIADEIAFGERFTLTPQLRYERQTLTSYDNIDGVQCFGPTTCIVTPGLADGTSFTSEAFTGAVSGRFALTDDIAVFGTLAYNENLPILDDLRDTTYRTQKEKGRTIELGLSYDSVGVFTGEDALKAKLTGFHTHIWDGTTYSGAAVVDLKGAEFELSYVHPAFYADFNVARTRGTVNDTSDPFNWAPSDKAQLTLGKRFFDDQLNLAVEAVHAWENTRTTGTSGATAPSDSYTIYALTAAYVPNHGAAKDVEFRASVENLFDAEYRPYLNTRNGLGRNIKFSIAKTF